MGKSGENSEDVAVGLTYEFVSIVREEIGFNELFCTQIADALVRGLRKRLGGQEIYIPAPDKSQRDAQIKAEFNGTNLDFICKKYGLRKSAIYRIIKR